MSVFGLVHGSWHGAWCWDLLVQELERRGHRAVAVDLPAEDWSAGYAEHVRVVTDALADAGEDVVLVGHSLGGSVLPVVAAERPVRRLVFLCALVPRPGKSIDDILAIEPDTFTERWRTFPRVVHDDGSVTWEPGAAIQAFYHDCDPELARWAAGRLRRQVWTISREPCPVSTWPDVDYSVVYCRDDRVIDADWAVDVAREVLEVEPVALPGGHSPMLSRPAALADVLVAEAVPARG